MTQYPLNRQTNHWLCRCGHPLGEHLYSSQRPESCVAARCGCEKPDIACDLCGGRHVDLQPVGRFAVCDDCRAKYDDQEENPLCTSASTAPPAGRTPCPTTQAGARGA